MPDVNSIPFKQASGNGHYESKQLPNDNQDFLAILGLPVSLGNVTSVTTPSRDGQLATYWQTGGLTIKGSTAIGIVDLVDGVVTTRLSPSGDIVGTTAIQTVSNKTLTNASIVSPSGLTKTDVGLANVDNTSDVNKPVGTATQLALNLKENSANKNVANGYAGLDATGKVSSAQLPASVSGTVSYQGTWDASTNTPTIPAAGAGNKGWYYVVSVAGTVSISGVASWGVGDWLVSNGVAWDKVDNTDAVTSVAGKTGAVALAKADVGLSNVDNTSDDAKNSAVATLTNKTIAGANNTLAVRLNADVVNNLPVTNLNNGVGATSSTWWCGDGQWKAPAGAGDVVGPAGAANGSLVTFDGATGKLIRVPAGNEVLAAISPSIWNVRARSYNAVGNANFEVDQRLVGAGVVNVPASQVTFVQDRWAVVRVGTMTVNSSRLSTGANLAVGPYYQSISLTTQQASLAAGDALRLFTTIEGSQMRELMNDTHSLSLMVRTNTTPLKFAVTLYDVPGTRWLSKLCTISVADTWTLISLPNLPMWAAGGNWSTAPGIEGYSLSIGLAAGANFIPAANDVWQSSGAAYGAVGMDNFAARAVGSRFEVAYVQHEPTSECSQWIDVPFAQNYDGCLRYFCKSYNYATAIGSVTNIGLRAMVAQAALGYAFGPLVWPKPMAKTPTFTAYNHNTGAANSVRDGSAVSHTVTGAEATSVGETGATGLAFTPALAGANQVYFHFKCDTGW